MVFGTSVEGLKGSRERLLAIERRTWSRSHARDIKENMVSVMTTSVLSDSGAEGSEYVPSLAYESTSSTPPTVPTTMITCVMACSATEPPAFVALPNRRRYFHRVHSLSAIVLEPEPIASA